MRTENIKRRISELEEIATSELDWEQIIYCDEKYEITLSRDYYNERGFYLLIEGENGAVTLEELPEPVQEKILEELENCNLEEAIIDTVNEA